MNWVMAAPKLDAKRFWGVRYNQALACVRPVFSPRYNTNDHDL